MLLILLILAIISMASLSVASMISYSSAKPSHFIAKSQFQGDISRPVDLSSMGSPRSGSIWEGNIMARDHEFIGSILSDNSDFNSFQTPFTGDVQKEFNDVDDALEGYAGGISDIFELEGGSNKNKSKHKNDATVQQLKKLMQKDKTKSVVGQDVKSPTNFLTKKLATKVATSGASEEQKSKLIETLAVKSTIPGEVARTVDFSRFVIIGGAISITSTELFIKGENLVKNLDLWQVNHPGLSRVLTGTSIANTPLVFSFVEFDSNKNEIPRTIPIILTFTTPELTKMQSVETKVSLTAKDVNGKVVILPGDYFFIFTENTKSRIIILPATPIKQTLFINPLLTTTADPLVITIEGLPAGVNVNCKLCGFDSAEWKDYKQMLSLA